MDAWDSAATVSELSRLCAVAADGMFGGVAPAGGAPSVTDASAVATTAMTVVRMRTIGDSCPSAAA